MKLITLFFFYILTMSYALAGPGAHGPNGEHLDTPGGQAHVDATPRIETATESFELVGRLYESELSVLIDRYETNEPVLDGKLEVELNGVKAPATFRGDHGDYSVTDAAFLKALSTPGKHALVFTLAAADESDLLEGTLEVRAADRAVAHSHFPWAWTGAGIVAVLALIALVARLRRAQTSTGK